MTIQWVLIASFLYFELALTALLVLPFISSRIWKKIACFSLWKKVERKANMYFTVFIVVLILFFLDSIREMMKYSGIHPHDNAAAIQVHAKLFRSQRNYFIVGFAIFLCLVIRRLLMLLVTEANLFEKNKEAESALKAAEKSKENAEKLIVNEKGDCHSQAQNESLIKEIEKVHEDLLKKENEIESINQNREDLLERCRQYVDDCNSLQEKINSLKGSTANLENESL